MSYDQLNDEPPCEAWAWNVAYRGEPAKGQRTVIVNVRVAREFARQNFNTIATALESRYGWVAHRHAGWGTHDHCEDPLIVLSVAVRAREIRAGVAQRLLT